MKRFFTLLTVTISVTLSLCINAFAEKTPLQATITVEENYFTHQKDIDVTITITNTSQESMRLLQWLLPKERLDSNVFSVMRDGTPISYQGRLIKRAAPTEKNYLVLPAGGSYIATVELSSAYDISTSGNYEIQLQIDNMITQSAVAGTANQGEQKQTRERNVVVQSNKVSFWVEGSANVDNKATNQESAIPLSPDRPLADTQACSNSERNQINTAANAAEDMASDAYSYLNNGPIRSRYTTWFGTNNTNRRNIVKNNFSAILDAVSNKPVVYDCSCNEDYYAYVYPSRPYTVYLCNAFWRAPTIGTDSKAGTIIHELSHFYVVASTDDIVYGQSGAKRLAINSPERAIQNADSHEYFAENTPRLP